MLLFEVQERGIKISDLRLINLSALARLAHAAVRKWKKKVEDECGDIPMVLVQNKIDLVSQSEIDQ
jgi:Ras-related protein Rab-23